MLGPALPCNGQLSARGPCRPAHWRRATERRQLLARAADPQQAQPGVQRTADVIKRDLDFLEAHTGLDLATPLERVVTAHVAMHDEVVALLNPIAGRQIKGDLESQIAGLQQQLAVAHQQVHATEQRVDDTMCNLTELEDSLRRAWTASPPTAGPSSPQQQLPLASLAAAPTSSRSSSSSGAAAAVAEAAAAAPLAPPAQQQRPRPSGGRGRGSGLQSSLALPENLKNFWYPVEFSSRLGSEAMLTLELFEETWVLFRDESAAAGCIKDECAHRACPLSLGKLVGGQPQCPYHGWQYDRTGACTKMPSTVFCKGLAVKALPVVEQDGLVWVWPGDPALALASAGPPASAQPPQGFQVHAELVMDVPVEHGLLLENLLDLAHAPFTHTSTFAKGWPIPEVVRFHAGKLLGGHWEPYPIDMSFEPPCMVLSTIGLAQPGKIERGARAGDCANHLHQLHCCLPSSPGRTKLLYRMSLDFLHWTKHVPGIMRFWENIAAQVLGEDLVLVAGQQDRLARGGDVWKNPVPFDKLGVRYRRWRNAVAEGDDAWRQRIESKLRPLSAGELFDHSSASEAEEDEEFASWAQQQR